MEDGAMDTAVTENVAEDYTEQNEPVDGEPAAWDTEGQREAGRKKAHREGLNENAETNEITRKPAPKAAKTEGSVGDELADADAPADQADKQEKSMESMDPKEVKGLLQKMGLPEEVECIKTKSGEIKLVVPMDGKKYLASISDVIRGFNLNQVGYKRLQEGKELESKMNNFFEQVKEAPRKIWDIADKLGLDKFQLAEELLQDYVQETQLSPEQKTARDKEREAEGLRAELEQMKRQHAEREHQELVSKRREEIGSEMVKAMTKHGFKPWQDGASPSETREKSSIMASAVGKLMLAQQYERNLSVDDAVYLAKQEWQDQIVRTFDDIDDDQIVSIIPERIIKAIRSADIARIRGDGTPTSNQKAQYDQQVNLEEEGSSQSRRRKKQTVTDFFENLG